MNRPGQPPASTPVAMAEPDSPSRAPARRDDELRQAESALRRSERRFRQLFEMAPIGKAIVSLDGVFIDANPAMCRITGYPLQELQALTFQQITAAEDLDADVEQAAALVAGTIDSYRMDKRYVRKDGSRIWIQLDASLLRDDAGNPVHFLAQVQDISQRKAAHDRLQDLMQRNALALRAGDIGIWEWDVVSGEISWDAQMYSIYGVPMGQPVNYATWSDAVIEEDRNGASEVLRKTIASRSASDNAFRILHPQRGVRHIEASEDVVVDDDERVIRVVGVNRDVTEQRTFEARLEQLAHYDPLTHLANRALLAENAQKMIAEADRAGVRLAVLFIDLDRFKVINDTLGHDAGDRVLKHVSEVLQGVTRPGDCVGRNGGDEFVILLGNIRSDRDVVRLAESIFDRVRQPIVIAGQPVVARMSIGVSIYPEDGRDREDLFRCADSAMYHAKAEGRDNLQFYRPQLTERLQERVRIERDLRAALARDEFRLHYESIVRLGPGPSRGSEALLRWRHPQLGLLQPDRFIGVAEDSGLIVPIGEWVLGTACLAASISGSAVSVNVSPHQFKSERLVGAIADVLERTGLAGSRLCLEITEQCLLDDTEHTLDTLAVIKAMNVSIAIDDFGVGYSSMRYIKRFAPQVIKLDRSFIQDLGTSAEDGAIVRAMIAMAHHLNIAVVAEGVESEAQLAQLVREGCDFAQGYLFPSSELNELTG